MLRANAELGAAAEKLLPRRGPCRRVVHADIVGALQPLKVTGGKLNTVLVTRYDGTSQIATPTTWKRPT